MVKHCIGVWMIIFVFGLPFLGLVDLFPLHRFGMFARLPESGSLPVFRLVKFQNGQWQALTFGNAYFDDSYGKIWASRAWSDSLFRKKLTKVLSAKIPADSLPLAIEKINQLDVQRLSLKP